ncbi:MAG: TIGR00730 family Rossman fold protein [Mariprofundus sp.]
MTEMESINDLPEPLRSHVTNLLSDYQHDSPYKRALVIETMRLISSDIGNADIKLLAKTVAEIRKGLNVFKPYQAWRKVTVFGSARTPANHPRYAHVRDCALALKEAGFMIITGGGGGMMQAANEGASEANSFAININLPMEQHPNPVMDSSPRHFYCQYFFTRKLFFLKESDAVVLTPGGFGTLDEAFETLTLLQTGRNPPIPVVLLEAPGDDYWGPLTDAWMRRLANDHLIDANDNNLIFHTDSIRAIVDHISDYYINYHSFRYVGQCILLRMLNPLHDDAIQRLNAEFSDILSEGSIEQVFGWPKSDDACYSHLPRLRMHLDRKRMNVLPQIIRRMNALYQRSQQTA